MRVGDRNGGGKGNQTRSTLPYHLIAHAVTVPTNVSPGKRSPKKLRLGYEYANQLVVFKTTHLHCGDFFRLQGGPTSPARPRASNYTTTTADYMPI